MVSRQTSSAPSDDLQSDANVPISPGTRFPSVDCVRALAICGVVWIHTVARTPWQDLHVVGRFGAEAFAALAAFFLIYQSRRAKHQSFQALVIDRFQRLMIPFGLWVTIYLVLGFLASSWRVLNHLWFLPFLFLSMLALWPVANLTAQLNAPYRVCVAALMVGLGAATALIDLRLPISWPLTASIPIQHAWSYVPALLWGGALAAAFKGVIVPDRPCLPGSIGGMIAVAASIMMLWYGSEPMSPLFRGTAGVGAVVIAITAPNTMLTLALAPVGRAAYGIYLVHPTATFAFEHILSSFHVHQTFPILSGTFLSSMVVSYVAVTIMKRSSYTNWLIPDGKDSFRPVGSLESGVGVKTARTQADSRSSDFTHNRLQSPATGRTRLD
jgi:peptidoglycan/LPS O-acetylase OafA/YrhL